MKRGRLPLTALRTFEVAGRLESFTLAAEELFISQAAVSRQIRELEQLIGGQLFERRHRSVALTDSGRKLLAVLTPSFDRIDECLEDIRKASATSELKISVEPSFAACWLVPRLPEFQRRYPEVDVSIDADTRTIEFRTGQAQIAIRHSATITAWPRTESRHLIDVRMLPVIATDLLERGPPISSPQDLFAYGLLHEETRDAWSRWFDAAGVTMPETAKGPVYADDGLVLRGQGVALLDEAFAEEEIRAGRLRQLFGLTVSNGAYWLVARSFDRLAPAATDFAHWLAESFHSR